jgi:DNA-binding NarL/FixJ family response regulator
VAVQHRQRLFREGISQLLSAQDDVEVVARASTDADLFRACGEYRPSVAVIEGEAPDWDVARLVASLRRALPHLALIGLVASPVTDYEVARARRSGMSALVSGHAGISGVLAAARAATGPLASRRPEPVRRSAPPPSPTTLTEREIEVLSLIAAGLTGAGVASRLHVSPKTVENLKQRIFTKLGVQNQAHAVSVSMRTGLMRPDRVIDVAVGR